MPEASPNGTETELALAVTHGVPAEKWARTTGVPGITAWRWAKDPVIRPFAAMPVSLGAGLGTAIGANRKHGDLLPECCHFVAMADEARNSTKSQLAFAFAHGSSVAARACADEVPKRTAYRGSA